MSVHGGWNTIFFYHGGKIFGVGKNEDSQLGQGYEKGDSSTPDCTSRSLAVEIKIPGNPRILLFKTGVFCRTTVALTTKGLYGCGQGDDGQFGDSTRDNRPEMKLIEFYKGKAVENYFAEGFALWVALRNLKVFRSGWNSNGDLGNGNSQNVEVPQELKRSFMKSDNEKVIDIKGYSHTILLTDGGSAYSCGDWKRGKLGLGEEVFEGKTEFERVRVFGGKKVGVHVVEISAGGQHSLFFTRERSVYSCGDGEYGRLGHNNEKIRYFPELITSLKKKRIRKMVCGYQFSLFLLKDWTVYGCGFNGNSQMHLFSMASELNILVPTKFETKNHHQIIDIATTWYSTTLLTSRGEVYSTGKNADGQCCIGEETGSIKVLTKSKIELAVHSMLSDLRTLFRNKPTKLVDATVVTSFQ